MFENIPLLKVLPPPPEGFPKDCIRSYKEKGQKLIEAGILTEMDLLGLEVLCYAEKKIEIYIKEGKPASAQMIKNYHNFCKEMMLGPIELISTIRT